MQVFKEIWNFLRDPGNNRAILIVFAVAAGVWALFNFFAKSSPPPNNVTIIITVEQKEKLDELGINQKALQEAVEGLKHPQSVVNNFFIEINDNASIALEDLKQDLTNRDERHNDLEQKIKTLDANSPYIKEAEVTLQEGDYNRVEEILETAQENEPDNIPTATVAVNTPNNAKAVDENSTTFTPETDPNPDFTITIPNLSGNHKPGDEMTITLPGGVPMTFCYIPSGEFMMGSPEDKKSRDASESPQHLVKITEPFWMGKYEVTQEQWESVFGENSTHLNDRPNHPVESVSWNDCKIFLKLLNQSLKGSFRLPSEAEWEYACRAGTTTRFYWGNDLDLDEIDDFAWYFGNSPKGSKPVGEKKPNAFGLFDTSGNVWEWCEDDWHDNYFGSPDDGRAWVNLVRGDSRVLRSGVWYISYFDCRSASRTWDFPDGGYGAGFRVVLNYDG